MKRGYADTPEGQVHYVEEGQGEPILLLHQSPRSSRMYHKLIPLLSKEYRAIAIDMLGYGYSDSPPPGGARYGEPQNEVDSLMNVARNVIHVLDSLEIEKVHLMGWHTSAMIAGEAAAAWPERIATLIVFAYTVLEDERDTEIVAEMRRMGTRGSQVTQAADGAHMTSLWMRAYNNVLRHWLHNAKPPSDDWHKKPESVISPIFHPNPSRGLHTFLTEDQMDFLNSYVLDSMLCRGRYEPIYESLYSRDTKLPLPRIQAPTLHLQPESPYELFYKHRGHRVAEMVPNGENLIVKGSDDNSAELNPPIIAEAVLNWLRKHPL